MMTVIMQKLILLFYAFMSIYNRFDRPSDNKVSSNLSCVRFLSPGAGVLISQFLQGFHCWGSNALNNDLLYIRFIKNSVKTVNGGHINTNRLHLQAAKASATMTKERRYTL